MILVGRISKEKTKIFFRPKSKRKVTGVDGRCESSPLCTYIPNMTLPTPSLQPQTNLTWIYMLRPKHLAVIREATLHNIITKITLH